MSAIGREEKKEKQKEYVDEIKESDKNERVHLWASVGKLKSHRHHEALYLGTV